MRNSVILHALLLAGAAFFALRASDDEKNVDADAEPALISAELALVDKVHYVAGPLDATIVRTGKPADETWAVTLTREVKIRPDADAKVVEKPGAPAEVVDGGPEAIVEPTEVKTFRFPASRRVTRSLEKLVPLVPKRDLGKVDASRLDKMGLGEDAGQLVLTIAGKTTTFRLGRDMYGGGGRYVQNERGEVFLIENGAVSGFDGDEVRLSERRVATVPLTEITNASFEVGDAVRAYVHENRADTKDNFFAPTDKSEEQSEAAMDAVNTLRRMKAKRFVDAAELSDTIKSDVRARFRFAREAHSEFVGTVLGTDDGFGYVSVGPWMLALTLKDHAQTIEVVQAAANATPAPTNPASGTGKTP